MRKYEEEHYRFDNIKEVIYPWVKCNFKDTHALNGKHFSEKDTPIIPFVGDLNVVFVIKRGDEQFEILKDNMLAPNTDIAALYHKACENLVRDVEFTIGNTWYGAFGILADGYHEASAVLFKHIWQVCVDKLKDDLVIMVPAKDMVLFVPASNKKQIEDMYAYGMEAYNRNKDKISDKLYCFTKNEKELIVYGS